MEQRNRGKGSAKRSKYGKKKNRVTKPDARADWTRTGKEDKKRRQKTKKQEEQKEKEKHNSDQEQKRNRTKWWMIYPTGQNKKSWEPDRRAALFALFGFALLSRRVESTLN